MNNTVEMNLNGQNLPNNNGSGYPNNLAAANYAINQLAARRWSPREFDENRPVEMNKVFALLEAARWAPSCFNEQPWNYLVFDNSNPDALRRARNCLIGFNSWAEKAPVLMLSVARENFNNGGKPNRHAQHDLGLASQNLVLEAVNQGLVAHQMGGFDLARARREFNIPASCTPMAMIAIGYPFNNARNNLANRFRSNNENQVRQRQPIETFAFRGNWKIPYNENQ
ncbi:MAG TPA: nitroreductase family protein [Blastocatellia bacterium]|nr:nitroreductase family protein [Blastocatellia bacterium]